MSKATRYPPELRERAIRLVRECRFDRVAVVARRERWGKLAAVRSHLGELNAY